MCRSSNHKFHISNDSRACDGRLIKKDLQNLLGPIQPTKSHGLSQPPTTRPPSPSIPPSLPLLHATNVSRPTSSSMDSAHLMTLLNFQTMSSPPISNASPEVSSSNVVTIAVPSAPPMNLDPNSGSGRNTRNNLPKGRHLKGEHIVYDIDNRLPGESQPQLEVSPITMYASDPPLVGRQIAVNRSYICYGLRANRHIRILNIHTASRGLLRGHSEVQIHTCTLISNSAFLSL